MSTQGKTSTQGEHTRKGDANTTPTNESRAKEHHKWPDHFKRQHKHKAIDTPQRGEGESDRDQAPQGNQKKEENKKKKT